MKTVLAILFLAVFAKGQTPPEPGWKDFGPLIDRHMNEKLTVYDSALRPSRKPVYVDSTGIDSANVRARAALRKLDTLFYRTDILFLLQDWKEYKEYCRTDTTGLGAYEANRKRLGQYAIWPEKVPSFPGFMEFLDRKSRRGK